MKVTTMFSLALVSRKMNMVTTVTYPYSTLKLCTALLLSTDKSTVS